MLNKEKIKRIRNFQSKDWWAAIFGRPMAILLLIFIADIKWITPNRLTTLSKIFFLSAVVLIFAGSYTCFVWAAVILQLSFILDNADGTLARYRNICTAIGSFYDKVSDAVYFLLLTIAISWSAYKIYPDQPVLLILGQLSAYALLMTGYMKWIQTNLELINAIKRFKEVKADLPNFLTRSEVSEPPPQRTLKEWLKWFFWINTKIIYFEEMDLFFWIGLGLILNRLDLLLYLLAVTQSLFAIVMLIRRTRAIMKLDR